MPEHPCYTNLLGLICSVFESYSSVLVLPKEGTENFKVDASFSLGDDIDENVEIVAGKSLVGLVLQDQDPLRVDNVEQIQANLGYYKGNDDFIKAFMACPLGDGRGVLCVDSKRKYSFTDKHQRILQLFAGIISDIQETLNSNILFKSIAWYYEKLGQIYSLRDRFRQWDIFLKNFLQIISEATGFQYCFFVARDATGEKYFLEGENQINLNLKGKVNEFPIGSGLLGWVFNNASPLFANAGEAALGVPLFGKVTAIKELQAVACLPLNINHITRGVLCLAHDQPVDITKEMKEFLTMASNYLALFLEDLYLKSKLLEKSSVEAAPKDDIKGNQ